MSNLRKDDRKRFISQKRTISTNKFKHINLIIQFDEIVVDRDELLLIKENQNNLNKNNYDNQLENFEQ